MAQINIAGTLHNTEEIQGDALHSHVVANANEVLDTDRGQKQNEVNTSLQEAINNRYTKAETYSREQLNSMITTPEQGYVSVAATQETTDVTDVLPAQGEANTIYRVGSWDGTQYDATVYSEYAWDGTQYNLLSVKNGGMDAVPTAGSHNAVESGGVYQAIKDASNDSVVNVSDYKMADVDKDYKIYHAIDSDDVEHHYLDQAFHGRLELDDPTNTNIGSSSVIDSDGYKEADIDKNGQIYHAIDSDDVEHHYLDQAFHGRLELDDPTNTNIGSSSVVDSDEYKEADIDKNGQIYHAIDSDDVEHHYLDQVFHGSVTMPASAKHLNVLVIGNSFTYDMLSYVPEFIASSGATDNITIYHITVSGGYLEFYSGIIDAGDALNNHSYGGNVVKVMRVIGSDMGISASNTMVEIFAKNWDMLTLCQVSGYTIDYNTFKPYLCKIMTTFNRYCPNKDCKKSWLTSWSRGNKESIPDAIKMLTGWTNIMSVVRQLDADFGREIDTYIPASTAIQNARNTQINPVGDFTRDWHHAATGYGVWMVGACFYEAVIAPFNGVSFWSFNYYKTVTQEEIDNYYDEYGTVVGSVTAENINTLRTCVANALVNQFEIV